MQTMRCRRCGFESATFFRQSLPAGQVGHAGASSTQSVCRGCEQIQRDLAKAENQFRVKAQACLQNHARKYGFKPKTFSYQYGWDVGQLAHDIEHASRDGCPYCHRAFAEMSKGLADVTLDILDPEKLPFYQTNTRWVCARCNREKQRMPPELFGQYLRDRARWRAHQERQQEDPLFGLPLFDE